MARKRDHITKGQRFSIFQRDGFQCQYCGRLVPDVILHLDHIMPVSKGGTNDPSNLITSCEACNIGKGAKTLQAAKSPKPQEDLTERREQISAFYQYQRTIEQELDEQVEGALNHWITYRNWGKVPDPVSLRRFLRMFGYSRVLEAMDIALGKQSVGAYAHSYMFGILHNWRKAAEASIKQPEPEPAPRRKPLFGAGSPWAEEDNG